MKPIIQTPLETIRVQEEALKAKDAQLQMLGLALTEEKIKNAQKDMMLNQLGQELTKLKIEVLALKGAVNQ